MKILHNPRCTKSRETLALIEASGKDVQVVDYLKEPPTEKEIADILSKLGIQAEQLVRKNEDLYKEKFKGKTLSEKQWISAMAANPILMERPIVISGKRAVLGRPPENVKSLL